MTPQTCVSHILGPPPYAPQRSQGRGWAPVNIALVKYWGKRDTVLNLPLTSSLSVSLTCGTQTTLSLCENSDRFFLNGQALTQEDYQHHSHDEKEIAPQPNLTHLHAKIFTDRLSSFLDLFRTSGIFYHVETINDLPTRAGLASSASGFAALVRALDDLYDWKLRDDQMSLLARLGSGSATRSLFSGFSIWNRGERADGMDSYADAFAPLWPDLQIAVILDTSAQGKAVDSRTGMQQSQKTSPAFETWPDRVANDLKRIQKAIRAHNFERLGSTAEANMLAMHNLTLTADPSFTYFSDHTRSVLDHIRKLRTQGLSLYATVDAGPHVKILFRNTDDRAVQSAFSSYKVLGPFLKQTLIQGRNHIEKRDFL